MMKTLHVLMLDIEGEKKSLLTSCIGVKPLEGAADHLHLAAQESPMPVCPQWR